VTSSGTTIQVECIFVKLSYNTNKANHSKRLRVDCRVGLLAFWNRTRNRFERRRQLAQGLLGLSQSFQGASGRDARRAERMLSIEVSSRLSVERLFGISGITGLRSREIEPAVQRSRNQAVRLSREVAKLSRTFGSAPGLVVSRSCDTLTTC
jgi:hypothetical protein